MREKRLLYYSLTEDQINFAYHNWFFDNNCRLGMDRCTYEVNEQEQVTRVFLRGKYELPRISQ